MATTKKLMGTTAVGGADLLAIEDVFSTYLYTGNGSIQTITNGIDLAGEGGLVWIKGRTGSAADHLLFDTERGATKALITNSTSSTFTNANTLTSFSTEGFSVGNYVYVNHDGSLGSSFPSIFASWTFRKAPRFFDVVTYTGDGVDGRTVSHNLGVAPGLIIVKKLDSAELWPVYHRSLGADYYIRLNETNPAILSLGYIWGDGTDEGAVEPTSTEFTIANIGYLNDSGATYVAYLFAHDPLGESGDGSDGLIACGSYTGNGSTTGPEIDLGWEPQWVMIKNATSAANWHINDNMRGMSVNSYAWLYPNLASAESYSSPATVVSPTATGFKIETTGTVINNSGDTYIYIAIRRGPMRQPESGTEVFDLTLTENASEPYVTSAFPVDTGLVGYRSGGGFYWGDRLRGANELAPSSTAAEAGSSMWQWDYQDGWLGSVSGANLFYSLRRAPGFFDVVIAPWADGSTNKHNLGVVPELIIKKTRSTTNDWYVWTTGFNNDDYLLLNSTAAKSNNVGNLWSSITATDFTTTNYGVTTSSVFYLFATLPGVSKVGSYTGNGGTGDINVDCGFTSGARFVLIKDATSANDWYVWDTARGIVAGNDPYLRLNSTGAETTDSDWVDPYSAGFTVTTGLLANLRINVSGNTYIFLAIA